MSDWTAGYVADIGYTYGYYAELNPLKARLAFLHAGLVPPEVSTACELGFGQGLSLAVHAATSDIAWYGTDFNPAQAAFAQELVSAASVDADVRDQSFAEFAAREDLPEFDFIGLHGIWSWISDENRAVIVNLIRRKLRVGGVVFMSYNTLPGWSGFAPLRQLMTEHANLMSADGVGIVSRINNAIEFTEKFLALNPGYARATPQAAPRFEKMKEHNRHYLAHEYFNKDWEPMYFSDVAKWFEPAKLGYACSAHYLDHVNGVNFTAEQVQFMAQIPDAMFRETIRDFFVNQQFRRDYWVKGARKLSPLQRVEQLRSQRVMLGVAREGIAMKTTGGLGEVTMREDIFNPVLDVLGDNQIHTIGEIADAVSSKGMQFSQVLEVVMILCGAGGLTPVHEEATIERNAAAACKLNVHLLDKARSSSDTSFLASPVTGGGVAVGRFQQLFLLAQLQGAKTPQDMARFAWKVLADQGQKLIKNGKPLDTPEDNLTDLRAQAETFVAKALPMLQLLKVI